MIATPDLVARVVAWHNRHPLARRIRPAQVQGVGMVVLPFVAALPGAALRAAFSEDFIAPVTPRRAAAFALHHGAREAPASAGLSREVLVDPALMGGVGPPTLLFLRTAALELGSRRIRVLLGDTATAPVLGPRLMSPVRCAIAAALLALGVGVGAWLGLGPAQESHSVRATAEPEGTVPAASAVAAAVPQRTPASQAPAPIPQPAAAPWPLKIRPVLDAQSALAARRQTVEIRALAGIVAGAAPSQAAPPGVQSGRNWALVARSTKSRMASELLLGFMQSAAPGGAAQRTEVLPSSQGWRAAWWPFESSQQAEQARAALATRGMAVEVVGF